MTAIGGLWRFNDRPDTADAVGRMLAAQWVYGPHGGAQWCEGSLSLGRRLYSLLPEDVHDQGPVHCGGGDLVGVADIRLDNRDELLRLLTIADPHDAICDAALLVASFERWGEAALDRLCGDFACAVWDRRQHRLILARDCLGNRPLHYHCGADFFAFASMPKGLHALAEIPRAPDCDFAAESMVLLPEYGTRTFFAGISSVQPGHLVTVSAGVARAHRYWRPQGPSRTRKGKDYYLEGVRHHLAQAVRTRLRGAGGQVASQLSAGLDSSAVTATAARVLGTSGGTVTAFTAVPRPGYLGPASPRLLFDEGPLATATASRYPNIEHVLVPGEGRSPFDALDRGFFLFERPIYGLYNLTWVEAICRAARQRGLTVMLTGDMGNTTISYDGFELLPALLLSGRWLTLLGELRGLVRNGYFSPLGSLAAALAPFLPPTLWQAIIRLRGTAIDMASYAPLAAERVRALDLRRRARRARILPRDSFAARLRMIALNDLGNFRKGYLAGWGIDQRDPTADRRLVEFCLSVPPDQFLVDGLARCLARQAFADRVPPEVLAERRRGWQAADWHEGLTASRGQMTAEIERLGDCAAAATTLDLLKLRTLVEDWPSGGWDSGRVSLTYREGLTRSLATGHFLYRATGGA